MLKLSDSCSSKLGAQFICIPNQEDFLSTADQSYVLLNTHQNNFASHVTFPTHQNNSVGHKPFLYDAHIFMKLALIMVGNSPSFETLYSSNSQGIPCTEFDLLT